MENDLNHFHSSPIPTISNPKIYIDVISSAPFGLPSGHFPTNYSNKILYAFHVFPYVAIQKILQYSVIKATSYTPPARGRPTIGCPRLLIHSTSGDPQYPASE